MEGNPMEITLAETVGGIYYLVIALSSLLGCFLVAMGFPGQFFPSVTAAILWLSGVSDEVRYQTLLVSLMAANLKPPMSTKILEDSSKLRPGYTLAQLKEDALSIEAAAKDADTSERGRSRSKSAKSSSAAKQSRSSERRKEKPQCQPQPTVAEDIS